MRIKSLLTATFGIALLAWGFVSICEFIIENHWPDDKTMWRNGGTEIVEVGNWSFNTDARLLAYADCVVPPAFCLFGLYLFHRAFKKSSRHNAQPRPDPATTIPPKPLK